MELALILSSLLNLAQAAALVAVVVVLTRRGIGTAPVYVPKPEKAEEPKSEIPKRPTAIHTASGMRPIT